MSQPKLYSKSEGVVHNCTMSRDGTVKHVLARVSSEFRLTCFMHIVTQASTRETTQEYLPQSGSIEYNEAP